MLKTEALGRGFQHLSRDLANVNAYKTMFDPYIDTRLVTIFCLASTAHRLIIHKHQ